MGTRGHLRAGLAAAIVAAALIGPLAAPASAAFSAPVRLSGVAINSPGVVNDADGNAIAVWSQYDGARWRVQVRQISATGDLGPVKTLSAAAERSVNPQIAEDGDGGAIVAWSQPNGVSAPVKARRISASGHLGALKTLSRGPRTARPRVASDGKGNAIVVWSQAQHGTWRIKAREVASTGALRRTKTLSGKSHNSKDPAIASDARGHAVAVWSQRGSVDSPVTTLSGPVKARRISAKGRLGSRKTLSRPGHGAGAARVAADAHGNAIAVWGQLDKNGEDEKIKARPIGKSGALGPVKTLAAANSDGPQIASNARGDATVVWDAFPPHGTRGTIHARQISTAGTLGPPQTLSVPGGIAGLPNVGTDAAGNATAVWSVYFTRADSPVQARGISASGTLGPLQTLSSADGIRDTEIAVNPEGDAFAVWTQLDGANWRVWGSFGP
jgi:hypothetical protein